MLAYRGDDPFGLGERLFIAEPENGPSEGFQLYLSQVVSQHDVIPLVDTAVDLQDEPKPVAGEVSEVPADRMLATEAVSVDPCTAKPLPQAALRQTGGLALSARESCALTSHNAIIDYLTECVSIPLPLGEGLSAQERSDWLRERVWVERRPSA